MIARRALVRKRASLQSWPSMVAARRYYLVSYGCQMNKLDGELVASRLLEAGYEPAATEEEADVVLLNTCSVREQAENRVLSKLGVLRRAKRRRPDLVVGVLGCMAEAHARDLQHRMPHVDLVVGPSAFGDIHEQVERACERNARLRDPLRGAGMTAVGRGADPDLIWRNVAVRPHRAQAFVSIMRGCNMPCTYCIVPRTRGAEVSREPGRILEEARRLVDDGVTEITLLGQTVNGYGRDLRPRSSLARLLEALHEIDGLRRLAFVTSHPVFLTRELIAAMAALPRVSRYLHLPAQSGSDRILAAMKRGYTVARYLERVAALQEAIPGIELQSDFIVGYPGETEQDFAATVELMERVRFAQSFVFKYSPRPGTEAAAVPDDVPPDEKERRNAILLEVQERHTWDRNRALVGTVQEVLVEGPSPRDPTRLTGRTVHHRIVHFRATDRSLVGRYVPVKITRALAHSLVGECVGVGV